VDSEAEIMGAGFIYPEKLVTTEWVEDHLDDPGVRIVESNEDVLLYALKHIPGAVHIDWVSDLSDPLVRDYVDRQQFDQLLRRNGIAEGTRVVFYGDKNNWWACYALWVFELFGHTNSAIMDGGRVKWEQEGRRMTREVPSYPRTNYSAPERADYKIRAFRDDVMGHITHRLPLVDVRSPGEYSGELFHMEGYPQEGSLQQVISRSGQCTLSEQPPLDGPLDPSGLRDLFGPAEDFSRATT
jgi:thiosulfate/3-mercaptopyruvate sulfurtransferase